MANRLRMADITAIRALLQRGWSYRKIARELGIHRETVARYASPGDPAGSKPAKVTPGSAPDSKPAKVTPGSEGVAKPKPAKVTPGSRSQCEPFRDTIMAKLEAGLSAQRIYQDLHGEEGFDASYQSVKRFVRCVTSKHPLPFRRLETMPGSSRTGAIREK